MPRWEHEQEERLKQAALELFQEQGFEDTSASRSPNAPASPPDLFRYFRDKEEVIFADADTLKETLVHDLLQADDVSEPPPGGDPDPGRVRLGADSITVETQHREPR